MNRDRIEGNGKVLRGKAKEIWGKLTDDQLDVVSGKGDQLAGIIQKQYGIGKEEAHEQIAHFQKRAESERWLDTIDQRGGH